MNYINDIPLFNFADKFTTLNMIIEIPKGTRNKYELDIKKFNTLEKVRKVHKKYPFYYGCFPQTLAGDGDALDAILMTEGHYDPMDIVEVRVVGIIKTIDAGEIDDKVLVTPANEIVDLNRWSKKVIKFLKVYKGKKADTQIDDHLYKFEEAMRIVNHAHDIFLDINHYQPRPKVNIDRIIEEQKEITNLGEEVSTTVVTEEVKKEKPRSKQKPTNILSSF